MKLMIMDVIEYTTSDGPGFRTSIYCSGCWHACKNCQNPQTWRLENGHAVDVEELYNQVVRNEMADVTFSGGDPFYQPLGFAMLAKKIKETTNKTIWCYTGFVYEQIVNDPKLSVLLPYIDVLVDGEFVQSLHDSDLLFRGSSNQRLIDVKKSLKAGFAVDYDYNPFYISSEIKEKNRIF